jgi:hypothetical protein
MSEDVRHVEDENKNGRRAEGWRWMALAWMMANEIESGDEPSKSSENQSWMYVDEDVGGQDSEESRHRHWVSQDPRDELDDNHDDEDDDDDEEIDFRLEVGSDCGVESDPLEVDEHKIRMFDEAQRSRDMKRMTDPTSFMFLFHWSLLFYLAGWNSPTGCWNGYDRI